MHACACVCVEYLIHVNGKIGSVETVFFWLFRGFVFTDVYILESINFVVFTVIEDEVQKSIKPEIFKT